MLVLGALLLIDLFILDIDSLNNPVKLVLILVLLLVIDGLPTLPPSTIEIGLTSLYRVLHKVSSEINLIELP